jgi:hypothetical protein
MARGPANRNVSAVQSPGGSGRSAAPRSAYPPTCYTDAATTPRRSLEPIFSISQRRPPGFQRGFDLYDANFHQGKPGEDRYKSVERRAEDVANRALGWLSRHRQRPFFIWLHFDDAHDPHDPPEPFKSHYASAPYERRDRIYRLDRRKLRGGIAEARVVSELCHRHCRGPRGSLWRARTRAARNVSI